MISAIAAMRVPILATIINPPTSSTTPAAIANNCGVVIPVAVSSCVVRPATAAGRTTLDEIIGGGPADIHQFAGPGEDEDRSKGDTADNQENIHWLLSILVPGDSGLKFTRA